MFSAVCRYVLLYSFRIAYTIFKRVLIIIYTRGARFRKTITKAITLFRCVPRTCVRIARVSQSQFSDGFDRTAGLLETGFSSAVLAVCPVGVALFLTASNDGNPIRYRDENFMKRLRIGPEGGGRRVQGWKRAILNPGEHQRLENF